MNNRKVYACLGASSHVAESRADYDYYATDPIAIELLLQEEAFNNNIWECACGEGHLSKPLRASGYNVRESDLINRNTGCETLDFLTCADKWSGDIITNPPYTLAKEFIEKSLSLIPEGNKIAMFLKLTFLESKNRKQMFQETPFKTLYVSSSRINCAKNGDFSSQGSSAVGYGWYVWEKGFKGSPTIKWIN